MSVKEETQGGRSQRKQWNYNEIGDKRDQISERVIMMGNFEQFVD